VARRSQRHAVDPSQPYAFLVEEERAETGEVVGVATIFLTNRECPWKCLMCDLWKYTLTETVPAGAIPAQIDHALETIRKRRAGILPTQRRTSSETMQQGVTIDSAAGSVLDRLEACPTLRQIKLYNSGSFFDPQAIPVEDYPAIAERVRPFERVIVECHPALVNERCLRFRDLIADASQLEVAMGLETANPDTLEKLNKRMTLELFSRAAEFPRKNGIALRVFILVKPPFLDEAEGLYWTERSLDFAFQNGASVASLIPTRPGNGALEALAGQGQFAPPKLSTLEAALAYGIKLKKGRVFADLWNLERFSDCPECFPARAERLRQMNLKQEILPAVVCARCHSRCR